LIQAPTIGAITPSERFQHPVKNANTVPSIPGGVILAKRAKLGSKYRARLKHPKTTSVKTMKTISYIPIAKFHLIEKTK
jgi:hypothetical protein